MHSPANPFTSFCFSLVTSQLYNLNIRAAACSLCVLTLSEHRGLLVAIAVKPSWYYRLKYFSKEQNDLREWGLDLESSLSQGGFCSRPQRYAFMIAMHSYKGPCPKRSLFLFSNGIILSSRKQPVTLASLQSDGKSIWALLNKYYLTCLFSILPLVKLKEIAAY